MDINTEKPFTISVFINAENKNGDLLLTLRSVFSQTYKHIECLIAYRGLTDESMKLIQNIFPGVTCFAGEKEENINSVLTKAFAKASGCYFFFINSGNTFQSINVLERLQQNFDDNIELVYGNLVRIFPDQTQDVLNIHASVLDDDILFMNLDLVMVSLIKKELIIKHGIYDDRLKFSNNWFFIIKAIVIDRVSNKYVDIPVINALVNRAGGIDRLSNGHLITKEKLYVFNDIFPNLRKHTTLYQQNKFEDHFVNIKPFVYSYVKPYIEKAKYQWRSYRSEMELKDYKKKYSNICYNIPIIINNRNHVTYLKKLIDSLEKRGYKNIFIIDNDSNYNPLLDYYKGIKHKVFFLKENIGFCALWDTDIFDDFKDQYYVYTDSDLEIIDECPQDFMVVMHYLLNRYSLGKVGFSLLTNDLPKYFENRNEVIKWEGKFQQDKIEKLAYNAAIDTTFALYKPNSFGYAGMLSSFRTSYPYSARHLPWYEETKRLTAEQAYYYEHAKTSSHWSEKIKLANKLTN